MHVNVLLRKDYRETLQLGVGETKPMTGLWLETRNREQEI